MIGESLTCTPEFWAKISTIKVAEEMNAYLTMLGRNLGISFSSGSRQTQSLCWVKERVAINASNATETEIIQPLKCILPNITCSSA